MTDHIDITVRGYHLDAFHHVNNARYLEFLEEARWTIFEEAIQKLFKLDYSFTIVNINISFKRAALLHQVLHVDAKLSKINNKSFIIKQQVILRDTGEIITEADVTCVIIDNKTGKALPIEGELAELI